MEVKIKKIQDNYIELETIDEDPAFLGAISDILLKNPDVEFCTFKIEHPQISHPLLILRTKKSDPIKLILQATEELEEQIKTLKNSLKKKK
jgi:DNA-directed RNA polymerase subunit L